MTHSADHSIRLRALQWGSSERLYGWPRAPVWIKGRSWSHWASEGSPVDQHSVWVNWESGQSFYKYHYETQGAIIFCSFCLFVCLFVQIQSAHTFLTFLNRSENWTTWEFFFTLFKILYCFNISSSLYRTDLKYTSSKPAHTSRVCALLTQSCLTPCRPLT